MTHVTILEFHKWKKIQHDESLSKLSCQIYKKRKDLKNGDANTVFLGKLSTVGASQGKLAYMQPEPVILASK